MAEARERLNTPGSRKRALLPKVELDSDSFGRFAEWVARFMGTAKFLAWMTVFVIAWVTLNVVSIWHYKWDPYPFILLNLFFSTQASYSAPLILLAQNRQEARDRLTMEEDRRVAAQSRADMDFLAREIASIRMTMGEMATRDYLRGELRSGLRELLAELERDEDEEPTDQRRDSWLRDQRGGKDRR
ncbi:MULTISPECIES: DUF1003 domain-containing protein [unclassified Luteococcus]|uniref:DUF1003 domain-containing protein n=1 Tax=unclassified Luteococcus TaxID=2639923 RepID=UPI00313D35EF